MGGMAHRRWTVGVVAVVALLAVAALVLLGGSGNGAAVDSSASGGSTATATVARRTLAENLTTSGTIGYAGETGRAFGPHLHFELYPAGVPYGDIYKAIDPLPWLRAHGLQTH